MHAPAFILGSPRSGTSILVTALQRAGYRGFHEGHLLPLIRIIERAVDRQFETFATEGAKILISQVDRANLKARLTDIIGAEAAAHHGHGPWLDKTGGVEMIESVPTLCRIFPDARFVFAQRRAIENVVSRLVKFPRHGFEYHCTSWAKVMAAWRALRTALPELACIEIDQRDISAAPAETARRLADFLSIDDAACESMAATFTSRRPQETQPGSADRVLTLAGTGWSEAQKAIFSRVCDAEMQAAGYTTDESYRGVAPP
jgi:hypothetical protein